METPKTSPTPESPPRRRRRWLRRAVWALGILSLLVGILHTPPAKRLAAHAVAHFTGRLLDAQVTIGRLDYRLWAGTVSVEGVEVRRPGLEIDCARAGVAVLVHGGLQVRLEAPRVVAAQGPKTADQPTPGPSRPWAVVSFFEEVDLEGGALELRNRKGRPWLRLEGLEARLRSPEGHLRGAARVAEAAVGWPGAGIRVESLSGEAELEIEAGTGAVRILRGEVVSGETRLQGEGRLEQIQPIFASARAEARLDASLVQLLLPELKIDGRLTARASFDKDAQGARGSVDAEAAAVQAFGVGPWEGTMKGRLEDWLLHIESLEASGYRGGARATGRLSLRDGPSSLDLQARDLDLKALVGRFAKTPPPLSSRASADLQVALQEWDLDTLEVRGQASLAPGAGPGWPVSGPVNVRLADRSVSFDTDALRVRDARLAAEVSLSFASELDARYVLGLADLSGAPALAADTGVELPNVALGGRVEVEGTLSGRLPEWQGGARIFSERLSVEGLDAGVVGVLGLSRAGIQIESLELEGEDGRAMVTGFIPLDEAGAWDVTAQIPELRLSDALRRHGVPVPTRAMGRLDVAGPKDDPTATYRLEARAESPRGDSGKDRTGVTSPAEEQSQEDQRPRPRAATMSVTGSASRRGVVVDDVTGEIGGGRLEAQGIWDPEDDSLKARVELVDVEIRKLPWAPLPARLEELSSTLSGRADLEGRLHRPEGRVHLALHANALGHETLPDVTLESTLDGARATILGRLEDQRVLEGRLSFADGVVHLGLDLAAVPAARLLQALPGASTAQRTLSVKGQAALDGTLGSLDELRYELRVEALEADLGAGGTSAGPFVVKGSRQTLSVQGFELTRGQSRLRIDGELGLTVDSTSPLVLHGKIPLSDLTLLVPDSELEGLAEVDLRLGGRLTALDPVGEVKVSGPRGRIGALRWEGLELEGIARDGVLNITRGGLGVAGGEASLQGSVPLGPLAQGVQTLNFELRGVDPAAVLQTDPGEPHLTAPLDVSGRIRAAALDLDEIEAEGEITRWSVAAGPKQLSLRDTARWRLGRDGLSLEGLRLEGDDGGGVSVDGHWTPDGPLQVTVAGEADLSFLNPLLGGDLRLSGPGRLDLTAASDAAEGLAFEGSVSLEGARAVLREPPLQVRNLAGTLQAHGTTLQLDASGTIGDGRVRTSGTVALALSGPEVDVLLDIDNVPLTFPEGLRSRSSGQVRLSGEKKRYRVEGEVAVHRALYDRETDFSNQSLDLIGSELLALDERGSILERVQLDVRVRLEDGLRVQNRQLQLVVDGAVALGGDLLTPELRGSVSLRDGGTVKLSRATMRLVDGRIDLAGFPSRPPEIDVAGRTQITGIQVDLDLTGPLDDLQTSLSSPNRSDLTQADLATLLLTGRTAQAAASESGAIVAEEVAAALGSALNERLGGAVLIDVSRDESLIVPDTDPTQRFNVGIPIASRLYITYSQALDRSGVRWILDFRPTGRFRVRLITDSNETSAVEVSHGLDFDLWSRGRRTRSKTPSKPRVREIQIDGVSETLELKLLHRSKLDPGDSYDFFGGEKAARRMREALVKEGHRAALVEARETPADEGRVDVVFRVELGPRIEVQWSGDDPGKKLRKSFGEAWDAFLSVEETAGRRAGELRNELRAERYYEALVTARVQPAEDGVRVTFEVTKGPRGRGVDLAFQGNASLSEESLASVLPPRNQADFFALLEPGGKSRLATALRTAGARAGFLSVQAGLPRQTFDPVSERLQVTIPLDEGERALLQHLDLPEEFVPEGASLPRLKLTVGEPFRIDAYVDDRRTLASWFRRQGFPEARVAGILDPGPAGMAVTFAVDAGPRPTIGRVRQARESRTHPGVIDNALTLGPGDLIQPEALARSRDHLSEARVFRSVDVRAETTSDARVRDLVVDLAERPDLAVEYKVRYETSGDNQTPDEEPQTEDTSGFQFGAGVEAANPFGRAHRYSVYGLVGSRRTFYGTTFEAQTFLGRRWRTQVFAFDDSDRNFDNTSIARRVRSVAFQQTKRWRSDLTGRRWHDRLRMQWGYGYRRIFYIDPVTGNELAGNRAGVSDSLIGDTRDSVTDPHRGLFWTLTAEPNLKVLGSDKNLVRLYGQVFAYIPFGSKVVWAQGIRIGAVPGDDPLLLLDRRFKAGGATTVRGFAENSLGPQSRGISLGGQALFVFNQELRFPVWKTIYAGVFFDTGNVWALSGDLDLGDLKSNIGGGVRVMFPFGPLRLDWAWVLDPKEGEQRSRWQFALGHAF